MEKEKWEILHLKSFPLSSDVVDLANNHLMWLTLRNKAHKSVCTCFFGKSNWRICEMMAIEELIACIILTHHMLQLMEVEVWGPVAKQVVKVVRGEIRRLKETIIQGYEKKLKSSYLVLRKGLNMEEKEWSCCCSPKRHHQISQSYQWGVNISKETNLIYQNKKSTMILLCRSFLWKRISWCWCKNVITRGNAKSWWRHLLCKWSCASFTASSHLVDKMTNPNFKNEYYFASKWF